MRFWAYGTIRVQPAEWEPGLVVLDCPPEAWSEAQLRINGVSQELSLRSISGQHVVVAEWERANAGSYHLEASWPGGADVTTWRLEPAKLAPGAFAAMLEDLRSRLPTEIALCLKRLGGLVGVELAPPEASTPAAELARLRRAIQGAPGTLGLAAVLTGLANEPHRVLVQHDVLSRFDRARRVQPARLAGAIRAQERYARGEVSFVHESHARASVDVFENRLVKLFYHQVDSRLHYLARYLEATSAASAATVWGLQSDLRRVRRRAAFLDEVTLPTFLPQQVTMVLLNVPLYRVALSGFLAFNRSLNVRFDSPALEAPLQNVPYLYEAWGTLQVISALLTEAESSGYKLVSERLVQRHANSLFVRVLPSQQALMVFEHPTVGSRLSLFAQPLYGKTGDLRSLTFTQNPDVAVELRVAGKIQLAIFDPKYKLDGELASEIGLTPRAARPQKVDIDKMHAYRDAIRDASGARVVRHAAILYPGPSVPYLDGLSAMGANPNESSSLKQELRKVVNQLM